MRGRARGVPHRSDSSLIMYLERVQASSRATAALMTEAHTVGELVQYVKKHGKAPKAAAVRPPPPAAYSGVGGDAHRRAVAGQYGPVVAQPAQPPRCRRFEGRSSPRCRGSGGRAGPGGSAP